MMNLKKLSVVLTLGATVALSGCAGPRSVMSITQDKMDSFEDYDLSMGKENNHSVAMQYMHLISKKRVHKANDLDANMDGYTNVSVRTTQAVAAVGVLASSLNPFQAIGTIFGQQSNLSKLHYIYKQNFIFTISAVATLSDAGIQKSLDENLNVMTAIISDAYKKDGSEVIVMKRGINYVVIPTNNEGNIEHCFYPEAINDIALVNPKGTERGRGNDNRVHGCYSKVSKYGLPYASTGDNGFGLPRGNFMIQLAYIPAAFPIDKLSSPQSGVYLYQTSPRFLKDKNLQNYIKNNKLDDIAPYIVERSAFVKVPVMTDLNSGKKLQFGTIDN
ncbi:hypothetical protein PE36_08071 [Moritella sp. PE36]|uniref:hypothetical protein n=1 Tax=Moritella sp. PE36 TaxID=58051 RepID=UPI0001568DBA|nr:hypothetical protein [Moritella sp. PE36]EDM65942.1 hypothetical protein PE36_08071 [Moritella sp. PE36]